MSDSSQLRFIAGNIQFHAEAWRKVTQDPWVLNAVQGVEIPFTSTPYQTIEPREYKMAHAQKQLMDQELKLLRDKGVIQVSAEEEGQFISNIFSRPKPNNRIRIIFDLNELNDFVEYQKFKMTSLKTAYSLLSPGAFMASIDLRDAYYSVSITKEHRKYLKFRWDNTLYQFNALPNGLACAPRFFTKIMIPVFAHVRAQAGNCFQYIDDSFIIDQTWQGCKDTVTTLHNTLGELGFFVHEEKSVTCPTTEITFLGFRINSINMSVTPTEEKREKMVKVGSQLLQKEWHKLRAVAGFVGLANSYSESSQYGGNHIKEIEMDLIKALAVNRGNFEAFMWLHNSSKHNINWWLSSIGSLAKDLRVRNPDDTMYTDASNQGWGAVMNGKKANGRWTEIQARDHINVLELRAVMFGLESLYTSERRVIKIMTDNATTVAYINRQGGVKSKECQRQAKRIWLWAEKTQNWIIAAHIPGKQNVIADLCSRQFKDNTEWQLSESIFEQCCNLWGTPTIDLFAAFNNTKTVRYAAWLPDPGAEIIDAFSIVWNHKLIYCFPPFALVARVLKKILADNSRAILICPDWPGQPWYGQIRTKPTQMIKFPRKTGNLFHNNPAMGADPLGRTPLVACLFSPSP